MRLKNSFKQKATPKVLKQAESSKGNLSVIVRFEKKERPAPKPVSPSQKATDLKKTAQQTTKRAEKIIRKSSDQDSSIQFRRSFLLNGLVVSAPVKTIAELADLDEVISIEENRTYKTQ